jgi:hypothetical protein
MAVIVERKLCGYDNQCIYISKLELCRSKSEDRLPVKFTVSAKNSCLKR